MSEQNPRKAGLSPSPIPLALLVVVVTVVAVGAIYLFTIGMTAPVPMQTGALTSSSEPNKNQDNKQESVPVAIATLQPTTTPPDTETPPPQEPTIEIVLDAPTSYTPGPTAQLTALPPTEEWSIYHDDVDGFSISYPTDWYFKTPSPNQEGSARTTQIYSYDPEDPSIGGKGQTVPSNYAVLEIVTDSPQSMGHPYIAGESFTEWVHRTWPIIEGIGPELLEERLITIGDRSGVVQDFQLLERRRIIYLPLGDRVLIINHRLEDPELTAQRALEMMIESIEFD